MVRSLSLPLVLLASLGFGVSVHGCAADDDLEELQLRSNPTACENGQGNKNGLDCDGDGFKKKDECDDGDDTVYPGAPDEECNGVDNDCDGEIDEDYSPLATACGVGQCAAAGQTACVNGEEVDSCVPGESSPEVCDDEDNDCDGEVDNGDVCAPACCGEGTVLACVPPPPKRKPACLTCDILNDRCLTEGRPPAECEKELASCQAEAGCGCCPEGLDRRCIPEDPKQCIEGCRKQRETDLVACQGTKCEANCTCNAENDYLACLTSCDGVERRRKACKRC